MILSLSPSQSHRERWRQSKKNEFVVLVVHTYGVYVGLPLKICDRWPKLPCNPHVKCMWLIRDLTAGLYSFWQSLRTWQCSVWVLQAACSAHQSRSRTPHWTATQGRFIPNFKTLSKPGEQLIQTTRTGSTLLAPSLKCPCASSVNMNVKLWWLKKSPMVPSNLRFLCDSAWESFGIHEPQLMETPSSALEFEKYRKHTQT